MIRILLSTRLGISIHAPARGATVGVAVEPTLVAISIHAPREGGDHWFDASKAQNMEFQSTPPARGATFRL